MYILYSASPVIVPSKPKASSLSINGLYVAPVTTGFVYTVKSPRDPDTVCTVIEVISSMLQSFAASNNHRSILIPRPAYPVNLNVLESKYA